MTTGYHTRWVLPDADPEDPERIAIRESRAFGKAVYDRRTALGLTPAEVAVRAGMTTDQIDCIEEGGTGPTITLLRAWPPPSTPTCASPLATTSARSASKPTRPDGPRPAPPRPPRSLTITHR